MRSLATTARVCAGVKRRFSRPTSRTSPAADRTTRAIDESHSNRASWLIDRADPSSSLAGSSPLSALTSREAGIVPSKLPSRSAWLSREARHWPSLPCPRPVSVQDPRSPFPPCRLSPPRFPPSFPASDARVEHPWAGVACALAAPRKEPAVPLRDFSTSTRVDKGTCTEMCGRMRAPVERTPASSCAVASSTKARARRSGNVRTSSALFLPMIALSAVSKTAAVSSENHPVTRMPEPSRAKARDSREASFFSASTPDAASWAKARDLIRRSNSRGAHFWA